MYKKYSTTVTESVADKQYMIHAWDRKLLGQQASFDRSMMTDRYSARRCLQSEIRKKNGIDKRAIPRSSIVKE